GRAAEAAVVTEAELPRAAVQTEDQVCVRFALRVRGDDLQLARHAQVEDEPPVAVEVADDPLAAALDGVDGLVPEGGVPALFPGRAQRLAAGLDGRDPPPRQVRAQVADHGFDFRQFRHDSLLSLRRRRLLDYKGGPRGAPSRFRGRIGRSGSRRAYPSILAATLE